MSKEFLNEIKKGDKNISEQIFREYFTYNAPSFLVKDFCENNKNKNDIFIKHFNESLFNLRNSFNGKEITKNENPNKIVNLVEKIFGLNKQQKDKILPRDFHRTQLKILTPKKML